MSDKQTFQWKPIFSWRGRYKCADTNVIGYRPSETKLVSQGGDPNVIIPYKCKGKGCEKHATIRHKGRTYCEDHRPRALKV